MLGAVDKVSRGFSQSAAFISDAVSPDFLFLLPCNGDFSVAFIIIWRQTAFVTAAGISV